MAFAPLLLGLVAYPLLEEWVFRGVLLREADERWPKWRGWRTNLAVSLLFGAAHIPAWPLVHAGAVVFPSLVLGGVWQRYRRLWMCVALHCGANACAYLSPLAVDWF